MIDDGEASSSEVPPDSIEPDDVSDPNDPYEEDGERGQVAPAFEAFIGPMPHPDFLERYEEILPGFSNRSLTILETEQKNRYEIDKQALDLSEKQIEHNTKRLIIQRVTNTLVVTIIGGFGLALALVVDQPELGSSVILVEAVGILVNTLLSNWRSSRRDPPPDDE